MKSGLAYLAAAAVLPLLQAAIAPPATNPSAAQSKQDLAWKRYLNKSVGYCIAYPAHWLRDDAFDGAGMSLETGVKRFSMPIGEMDVSAVPALGEPAQLLETHFEGVKKFVRARDVEILEHRDFNLSGSPALFAKDRYLDPLDKAEWIEELVFTRYNNLTYRMEMVCRASHVARFEPVFSRFVNSIKFDCNARH